MTLRRRRPGLVYPVNEDWHYVGATDEPAFNSTWANVSFLPKLAFRIRETGVVDIQGTVSGGTSTTVFTLPVGYRPSYNAGANASGYMTGHGRVIALVTVLTTGVVAVVANPDDTSDTYPGRVHFGAMQFYLHPPETA